MLVSPILIAIRSLIAAAAFFQPGVILAGAASVAEFLFIAGGAHTLLTVVAVILRTQAEWLAVVGFWSVTHNTSPSFFLLYSCENPVSRS